MKMTLPSSVPPNKSFFMTRRRRRRQPRRQRAQRLRSTFRARYCRKDGGILCRVHHQANVSQAKAAQEPVTQDLVATAGGHENYKTIQLMYDPHSYACTGLQLSSGSLITCTLQPHLKKDLRKKTIRFPISSGPSKRNAVSVGCRKHGGASHSNPSNPCFLALELCPPTKASPVQRSVAWGSSSQRFASRPFSGSDSVGKFSGLEAFGHRLR